MYYSSLDVSFYTCRAQFSSIFKVICICITQPVESGEKLRRGQIKQKDKKKETGNKSLRLWCWTSSALPLWSSFTKLYDRVKPMNTLRSMVSHSKDWAPLLSKPDAVYKVECGCCNALYVGETKRKLESRLVEHQKAVQRGEVNVSALVKHVWNSGHHVNLDSMAVVGVSYSRLELEVIHIRKKNSEPWPRKVKKSTTLS